jgi:AraC family transcriptional activator of pobA
MVAEAVGTSLPDVHADHVRCALQDRVFGMGGAAGERFRRGILLTSGTAAIITGEQEIPLKAPCLAWIPWRSERTVRVHAGGVGYYFTVGEEVLVDVIGNNPEAVNLRILEDRRVIASLEGEPATIADATHAFDLIVRELHRPRHGSWTMVLSQIRTLLVLLWRASGVEEIASRAQGEPSRILQRFRQLVEIHFRERWPVAAYADALGLSHDRLHDICRRELGKTPSRLIHERVVHEARLRLERSALTVEQVSSSLGFRDVGHFSRFFKSKVGLPPAAYRDRVTLAAADGAEVAETSYADWP